MVSKVESEVEILKKSRNHFERLLINAGNLNSQAKTTLEISENLKKKQCSKDYIHFLLKFKDCGGPVVDDKELNK